MIGYHICAIAEYDRTSMIAIAKLLLYDRTTIIAIAKHDHGSDIYDRDRQIQSDIYDRDCQIR